MNNGEFEELISDVKREIKCIEQYRVLTNKFVNENVSQYNINKFKEEQYIENFETYEDYDYDIYNWVYIKNFKNIVELAENLQQRIDKAIEIAYQYAQIDGAHHKMWTIDQMLRELLDSKYDEFIREYEEDGEYTWDIGISP